MATEHELGELKPGVWPWDCLVLIQCTKPPDVVKRTAELLAEVGRDEEGKRLKVLSALYLEKMVTEQNVKDLKAAKWPWKRLVQIQCTKLPDVVKKTAELLAKVGHNDEASLLKVLSTLYQEKMITEKEVVNMKATKSSWSHCIYIQCTKRYNVVKRTAELLAGVEHKEEVLATLYQERIVKMKDLKDLTAAAWPWSHCICIQCTNSPNVVTKTAELLAKVGRDEEANLLKVLSTLYQEKMGIDTHDLRLAPWPWSHFICIQCTRPLDVVTRTTKLLAEVRHYEERNLLKVLSTLNQEKMVTEPELEDLKSCEWPWLFLVPIQCTKAPDVVRRTAVLLAEVLRNEEATLLKVLSTLYQEKVVKEKDVKHLTAGDWPWSHCICILCTKGRKVVNKTAELLDEVGYNEEGNLLKVLAALYQKKTIAWRDLQNWKGHAQNMLLYLVLDQCPKSAEAVVTTADVLHEHGCRKEANMLKLLSNMRQKEMIAHHEMKYMRQSAREILWTMVEPVGQPDVKVHGVGEVLWQRLVDLQCRELQKVTAMNKMLDDLGLKEEATQLRSWLVCQSLAVISEIYQKKLISEDDLRCLPHYPYMMGYSSRHWLDSLVDIQSSKSADVHATTFDILRKHSLIDVGNKTQTKHTDVTEYESFMASFSSILVKSEKLPTLYTMRTLKQWSMLSEHLRSKAPPPTPMSPAQCSQTGTAGSLSVCSPTTRVASSTFAQVLLDHAEEFLN